MQFEQHWARSSYFLHYLTALSALVKKKVAYGSSVAIVGFHFCTTLQHFWEVDFHFCTTLQHFREVEFPFLHTLQHFWVFDFKISRFWAFQHMKIELSCRREHHFELWTALTFERNAHDSSRVRFWAKIPLLPPRVFLGTRNQKYRAVRSRKNRSDHRGKLKNFWINSFLHYLTAL